MVRTAHGFLFLCLRQIDVISAWSWAGCFTRALDWDERAAWRQ